MLRDGGQIQHARIAVRTDPNAERAILALEEAPDPTRPEHRITGKQPPEPIMPYVKPPKQSEEPELRGLRWCQDGSPVRHTIRTGGESLASLSSPTSSWRVVEEELIPGRVVCSECGLQVADNPMVCGAHGLRKRKLTIPTGCRFCETPLDKKTVTVRGEVECDFQDGVNLTCFYLVGVRIYTF